MNTELKINDLTFIVTMDLAFDILQKGIISAAEFKDFLEKMTQKYDQNNLGILYQTKLDIYLDKRVNTNRKGA